MSETGPAAEPEALDPAPIEPPGDGRLVLRDPPALTFLRRSADESLAFLDDLADQAGKQPDDGEADEPDLARLGWYHTIELPDGTVTPGMFDHRPLVEHYGLPDDLTGRRVLDVATADGFWAFEFERRGGDVVALDIHPADWDLPPGSVLRVSRRKASRLSIAGRLLGSSVRTEELSVYDLDPDRVGTFDFVHTADLLIHLERGLEALRRIRSVTREGGEFLIADAVDVELDGVDLVHYVGGWHHLMWWLPSVQALGQMIVDAGFSEVKVERIYNLAPAGGDGGALAGALQGDGLTRRIA